MSQTAPHLLRYFRYRSASSEDAADLMAETMVVAWSKLSRLPTDELGRRKWLYVTASNLLHAHRRKNSRTTALAAKLVDALQVVESDDETVDVELAIEVRSAVDALPDKQRELVMLIHWDGFSIADAAELLRLNASTARSRYGLARRSLRAALEPLGAELDTGVLNAQTPNNR